MNRYLIILLTLMLPMATNAGDGSKTSLPAVDSMEPEVVISPSSDGKIREYRVNGQLYMIEIKPVKGPVYYLVDRDGDGILDSRHGGADSEVVIPRWTLLRW